MYGSSFRRKIYSDSIIIFGAHARNRWHLMHDSIYYSIGYCVELYEIFRYSPKFSFSVLQYLELFYF
jgi:hypothetical protein